MARDAALEKRMTDAPLLHRLGDRIRFRLLGQRRWNREIVFGLGLSKTATSSLDRAMDILGYTTIHYPPIARVEGARCDLDWPWWMEKYDSANDLPVAATYRQLHERFPNATFILTVRDLDAWLDSCRKHFTEERAKGFEGVPRLEQARRLYLHMYGRTSFERTAFADAYRRHVDGVVDFFANRKPLTILDIPRGDAWPELCAAVGRPVPFVPFPMRNVRSEPNADPLDLV